MSELVTLQNLDKVLAKIGQLPHGAAIAVDCETTGLHPYQGDKLRGFSFAFRPPGYVGLESYYVPVGYPEGNLVEHKVVALCHAIKKVDPLYVYHHAKFDLRFLRQLPKDTDGGAFFPVPEKGKLRDTKVVAWLLDENLSTSLDAQAKFHLGAEKSTYMKQLVKERGGWDKLTAEDTAEYGANDAELTLRLYEHQSRLMVLGHPMLYGKKPAEAVEREMAVQGLLLRMEDNGIRLDSGALADLLEDTERQCKEIEERFLQDYAVNVNSPPQVAELLFVTLKDDIKRKDGKPIELGTIPTKNHPSVARSVLESLEDHPVVASVLKHRRLKKAVTGYLKPLMEFTADDDRVHPVFWSTGTKTGRFSCSDPNLQTIPRGDTLVGVRPLFVAEEGFELWSYDLNSAEMRVVAGMADEQVLIDGLNEGKDMHGLLAERVFGEGYSGIQRRYAKNIGYGFFYGLQSPTTAAEYISGPGAARTASKILNGLKEMYPGVVQLMAKETRRAEKLGVVPIGPAWPGRYRRFVTEAPLKPYPYTALNAQVQGGIGEFMKDVMLATEEPLAQVGARLCLQVHDELVIEVPEGEGPYVLEILQLAADKLNPFKMPMIFGGQAWGEHE